ncbi:MAG: hypothetical protein QNJ92_06690 [Alphaproteobacteria bacterium]|nr:hypothetical protein [Alphaproteobacteria bacterium]
MTQAAEEAKPDPLVEKERRVRTRLKQDFPLYAKHCLKIRTKDKKVAPLLLNEYQQILHETAERQLRETGRVRIIVPKARQGGVSTYVQGRAYHKTTHTKGMRAFILTHSDQATQNIFGMAKRFDENCPAPVRPQVSASNANELHFGLIDSGYKVATAKAAGVGRSDTIQFFHGSEVAFWPNAEEHATGALQAVPDGDGTEIWLESTGNGMGNYFYRMCQAALKGESEYEIVFLPWFLLVEYAKDVPDDWRPSDDWILYGNAFDLSREQLYWAFTKSRELAIADKLPTDKPCSRFLQEYPRTLEEAFQLRQTDSFISSDLALKCRKATPYRDESWPVILGVDVGRGGDASHIVDRKGRRMGDLYDKEIVSSDLMEVVAEVAIAIKKTKARQCAIDITGGWGSGVYDRLQERNLKCELVPVNYGGGARNKTRYANKRAEIYGGMREWMDDEGGASIPDDERWQVEICAATARRNSNEQTILEPKDDIKKRLGFSPNRADAAANTFAEPLGDWDGQGGLEDWEDDDEDYAVEDKLSW